MTSNTPLILKRGAKVETSKAQVEKIQKILNKVEEIAAKIRGIQFIGIPALQIKAGGIVNNKVTKTKRKLKSQGFEIECLLVSLAVTTIKPEAIAPIQA